MQNTGNEAAGGQAMPAGPEAEVEAALKGLVADLGGFRNEITTRLKQQEERMTMLDRKTQISAGRHWPVPAAETRRTTRPSRPMCATATTTPCAGWCWRARR